MADKDVLGKADAMMRRAGGTPIGSTTGAVPVLTELVEAPRVPDPQGELAREVLERVFAEVEGRFLDFGGNLLYDATHPERSRVDWRVRIASVETGAPNRDKSLQGPEYFDASNHPEMRFVSDQVRQLRAGQLEVQGRLTIRGRTRPVTVQVALGGTHVVPGEGTFEIFQTEFTVNRHDYGVVGGSVLGSAISRDVHVKIIGAVNHR